MSNDLTNSAKLLLHRGKGDPGRLDHIITTLNEGKNLYSSDQEYLEGLIEKYLPKEATKVESEDKSGKENPSGEVEELRKQVKALEEKVEKKDITDSWKQEHYKSLGTTLLLSLGVGIVLLGIGHFYVGKGRSGTGWLIGGLALAGVGFFASMVSGGIAGYGFAIVYFILWIIQALNAANYCKEWNQAVSKGIILW